MRPTTKSLVDRLHDSGLLARRDLHEFLKTLPVEERPKGGEQLARLLVRGKLLTAWQAEQVYSGSSRPLVLGNYVLLEKLGEGGMGTVFRAEHRRMKRRVALKVLPEKFLETPDLVARFQREVEAAARLNHPNIVIAHDADEADGVHFLVMEEVDGTDLSALVRTSGPLSFEKAASCVLQAARGLEYAHSQGVIHRDIKPSNLLLDSSGTVKILDMGLARLESDDEYRDHDPLTETGQVMGTVDFMAPEQAKDTHAADARSDIYSLGATLWYLLCGRPMYGSGSTVSRLLAHQNDPVPSLTEYYPQVPPELDSLFRRMVAKSPSERFQTMTDVIAALEEVCGSPQQARVLQQVHGEDSKFSEFLRNLETPGGIDPDRTVTVSPDAAASVAKSLQDGTTRQEGAPTVSLQFSDVETDPQTQKSRYGSLVSRRTARRSAPRTGLVVACCSAAVLLLLGIIVFSVTSKDDGGAGQNDSERLRAAGTERRKPPSGLAKTTAVSGSGSKNRGIDDSDFALSFDGKSSGVMIPSLHYDGSFPVTLEATINRDSATNAKIIQLGTSLSMASHARLLFEGSEDGAQKYVLRSDAPPPNHRRLRIAGVYDGKTLRLYIDGRLQKEVVQQSKDDQLIELSPADGPVRVSTRHPTAPTFLGTNSTEVSAPQIFDGTIDEVRISKGARYTGDYQPAERLEADEQTLALYHFDEGEGATLFDSSGHGHHGNIIGATWVHADGTSISKAEEWRYSRAENLGELVNSPQDDTEPLLTADGLTLIFASNRPGGAGGFDLWMSTRATVDDPFGPPENLGDAVNSPRDETGPTLTADGRNLIFASNRAGGAGDFDLWLARRTETALSFRRPVHLGTQINSPFRDSEPALSSDGKSLLFHSVRGSDSSQLWMSTRADASQPFGRPVNLGASFGVQQLQRSPAFADADHRVFFSAGRPDGDPGTLYSAWRARITSAFKRPVPVAGEVNSAAVETAPFVTPDGAILYFASDRPGGQGSLDLWLSRRMKQDGTVVRSPRSAAPVIGQLDEDVRTFLRGRTTMPDPLSDEVVGLVDRLVAVRQEFPGTAASQHAARLLAALSSPFDRLQAERIPDEELITAVSEIVERGVLPATGNAWEDSSLTKSQRQDIDRLLSWPTDDDARVGAARRLAPPELQGVFGSSRWLGHIGACGPVWDAQQRWLARVETSQVLFLNPQTGQRPAGVSDGEMNFRTVHRTEDGRHLLLGRGDGSILVVHVDGPSPRAALAFDAQGSVPDRPLSFGGIHAIDLNAGRLLTFGSDGRLVIRNRTDGTAITSVNAHEAAGWAFAASADRHVIATGALDGSLRVWNWTGSELRPAHTLTGHQHPVDAIAVSPDGQLIASASGPVSAPDECRVLIHDAGSGNAGSGKQLAAPEIAHRVVALAFRPDSGQLAAAGWTDHGGVRMWNCGQWDQPITVDPRTSGWDSGDVRGLSYSPDGTRLAIAAAAAVKILNLDSKQVIPACSAIARRATLTSSFDVALDGRRLAMIGSGTLDTFTVGTDESFRREIDLFKASVVRFGAKNSLLVGTNGAMQSFALPMLSHGRRLRWPLTGASLSGMAVSPAGVVVPSSDDGVARLFHSSGEMLAELTGHTGKVTGIAFSPDGSQLLCVTPGNGKEIDALLWDVARREVRLRLPQTSYTGVGIAYSPTGDQVALASNVAIRIFDTRTGWKRHEITGWSVDIQDIDWSPDGTRLLGIDAHGLLRVLDAQTGAEQLRRIFGPSYSSTRELRFTPDSRHVLVGNVNGTVSLLRLRNWSPDLIDAVPPTRPRG